MFGKVGVFVPLLQPNSQTASICCVQIFFAASVPTNASCRYAVAVAVGVAVYEVGLTGRERTSSLETKIADGECATVSFKENHT